ncbi:MAG: Fic family protein [Bacteroidia bacterium]|jgi:Fic family protein|nr:Fic family protein [Bacteroidia bacterium]
MANDLTQKYPWLSFKRDWSITHKGARLLGECTGLVKALCNTPILPDIAAQLLHVAMIKGAQATTAIEGNTLTEEEIKKIKEGIDLPPSKKYMEIEVQNILNAFNELLKQVVVEDNSRLITSEMIQEFHEMIGVHLGEHFDAIPGRFRQDNRVVGTYRCPDYDDVEVLMKNFCDWLREEFHYSSGEQEYYEVIIQAIVAHIYLEWIHPFGDGNGRTGRLLEFYILLRGKTPNIASHILSNHYNLTRAEYYRQIENAKEKRNLTQFIEYALLGFRDGLEQTLNLLQDGQMQITWQRHVYQSFDGLPIGSEEVMKRRRRLALDLPPDKSYTKKEIVLATPKIARAYAKLSERQVERELEELVKLGLLVKIEERFRVNTGILKNYIAMKKV